MSSKQKDKHQKLKKMILTAMLVVPALPFVLVLIIGYRYFTLTLEESATARLERIAADHRRAIQTFLNERQTDLELLTKTYGFEQLSRPEILKKAFEDLSAKSAAFSDLGVIDHTGTQVAYQGPFHLAGRDYGRAEWFQAVGRSGYFVSDVFLGYRRSPHFIIAVLRKQGDSFWVIRATIDTVQFSRLVEQVRIGEAGEAFILNREGFFQTKRRSGPGLLERDPAALRYLKASEQKGGQADHARDDSGFLWAWARINDGHWLLVVRQAEADAFSALRTVGLLVILVTLLGGAMIVALALYTTNDIIKRMRAADEEKNLLGQQLVVAGRLAEIGEMSAGFAHEVNNPLQIISSEQKLAASTLEEMIVREEIKPSANLDEVLESIDQIKVQVQRCAKITSGLLKFARQTEPAIQTVNLTTFIPEAISLVANKAKTAGIALEEILPTEPLRVKGDPGQIQQVLVNLLNNAIDAVATRESGRTGQIVVTVTADRGRVNVSISDNGSGIKTADLEKIFTPFFTTKPVGEGTGLGLPICYGIVDQMGGRLEVVSSEGNGTTVTITLPRYGSGETDSPSPGSAAGTGRISATGEINERYQTDAGR